MRGFLVAVGFCGHGFQHSPPAGKHMAELILDGHSSIDLSLFAPLRFERSTAVKDDGGAERVVG
jgi:sarcosine oxidase subunit beta